MYEVRPKPQGQKGHIVTSNDYGDVLEMINCYNLWENDLKLTFLYLFLITLNIE